MGHGPPIPPGGYTLHLERSKKKSMHGWCWEIRNASGKAHTWGARAGTKKDVIEHLSKSLNRLNNTQKTAYGYMTMRGKRQ